MIMTYNASFDWLRKSRDRANKTSYLPENIYHIPPPESFGIFLFQWYEKPRWAYDVNKYDKIYNV